MKRHLQPLIEVLVVHVVNAVHRMDVGFREPLHGRVEPRHDVVVVEESPVTGEVAGRNLIAGNLIAAAVDGVEQGFCEVHPGSEELHLLAEPHGRNAAGDRIVIAPIRAHQVVILILQR